MYEKNTDRFEEPVCRVPKYHPGHYFSFKEVPMNLSGDTLELLHSLDFAEQDCFACQIKPIEEIRGGKHHYSTNYNEQISPTNANVFALVRSSTNLQICDRNMSARYVPLVSSLEDMSKFEQESLKRLLKQQRTQLLTKKTGVKAPLERINREAQKRSNVSGRLISGTESLWNIMDFSYVCTNVEFVHVSSSPKEYRAAVVIQKSHNHS